MCEAHRGAVDSREDVAPELTQPLQRVNHAHHCTLCVPHELYFKSEVVKSWKILCIAPILQLHGEVQGPLCVGRTPPHLTAEPELLRQVSPLPQAPARLFTCITVSVPALPAAHEAGTLAIVL